MIKKFDEKYLEYQTKLNLSEIYSNEEIKLLKESIPDLNNLIYLVSNSDINISNNSKLFKDQINQHPYHYHYFSPSRKIKNNSNTSVLIDKEKFFSLLLEKIKNYFQNEQKFLLSKSISLLIDEILNISKIIKQNIIYNNFFKSIKNNKLVSYSKNKEKEYKNIKVRFNTKSPKNKNIENRNRNRNENTTEIIKDFNNYSNKTDINNIIDIKKQLTFKIENQNQKRNINNNKCNKSVFEIKLKGKIIKENSNRKDKDKSKINSI